MKNEVSSVLLADNCLSYYCYEGLIINCYDIFQCIFEIGSEWNAQRVSPYVS